MKNPKTFKELLNHNGLPIVGQMDVLWNRVSKTNLGGEKSTLVKELFNTQNEYFINLKKVSSN